MYEITQRMALDTRRILRPSLIISIFRNWRRLLEKEQRRKQAASRGAICRYDNRPQRGRGAITTSKRTHCTRLPSLTVSIDTAASREVTWKHIWSWHNSDQEMASHLSKSQSLQCYTGCHMVCQLPFLIWPYVSSHLPCWLCSGHTSSWKHRYSSASGLYTGCFHALECSSLTYSHSLLTLLPPSSISLNTIFFQ